MVTVHVSDKVIVAVVAFDTHGSTTGNASAWFTKTSKLSGEHVYKGTPPLLQENLLVLMLHCYWCSRQAAALAIPSYGCVRQMRTSASHASMLALLVAQPLPACWPLG
jgi:hypothetical protein